MSSIETTKSHRGVFCINKLNRTQVSIPKWIFRHRQEEGRINPFRREAPRARRLKMRRLDRAQHPIDISRLPLSGRNEMRGGNRGLRGRIFFVIHLDSGSPPGVHGSYHGILRFETEEQYFFVTNSERISKERWYEFNHGFRDSAPGYQELLRVINPEEVNP